MPGLGSATGFSVGALGFGACAEQYRYGPPLSTSPPVRLEEVHTLAAQSHARVRKHCSPTEAACFGQVRG